MTANRNFKRLVRARAVKTGQSYTTALRHFRPTPTGEAMPQQRRVKQHKAIWIAVAQTSLNEDPRDSAALKESGAEIRRLM